jgi:histidyl-tRNA synthetase
MQNVFRADKPQKGRFREFTQCDADIFGVSTTTADAEILAVFYAIFKAIGFTGVTIAINDRETLMSALSPFASDTVSVFSLIQSIDKLDKLTPDQVIAELEKKGLSSLDAKKAVDSVMSGVASNNLQEIMATAVNLGVDPEALKFEPTLARGLDYYTGLIFEAKIANYTVGSVGGGGRYDRLIGDLSGISIPAVGFGLGFDRIVEAASELGLIPLHGQQPKVLVTCFSSQQISYASNVTTKLRNASIATELYPDPEAKIAKQFKAADQKNIPFVVVIGQDEVEKQLITLKNMNTGEQKLLSIDEAISALSE